MKNNSREELRKKEDNINQLIHLVKAANLERDEARDQLQMLLNKLTLPNPVELFSVAPLQALGSSSLTGSDNLTDAPNNHSHDSSPTVIDESISPDLSIVNFADSSNALISQQHALNVCAPSTEDNMMKLIFEQLAKKPLPEKGRLLEAVIGAGPILETLFVAGSLPRWRNPPPLKPFLVPPLSIGGDHAALNQSCLILNSKRQKSQ